MTRAVLDMSARLADAGHEVTLLTCDDTDVPASWKAPAPVLRHPSPNPPNPGAAASLPASAPARDGTIGGPAGSGPAAVPTSVRLPRASGRLGRLGPDALSLAERTIRGADVAHIHAMWTTSNHQLARLCSRLGVPYVFSPHGMLDEWSMAQRSLKKRLFLNLVGYRTLAAAAQIHLTAQAELEQACRYFPRARGTVVPLIFDLQPFGTLPGPGAARARFRAFALDRPVLLFLSRMHYKKGADLLLRAVARLRDAGTPVAAVLAGRGDAAYESELHALAASLQLGELAEFPGMVTGGDKLSLLQAADMLVVPTSSENFGFVFVEALACATPVVTTRGVDIWPELAESGGARIVERSEGAIVDAVRGLLACRGDLPAMGARGREWVFRAFDARALVRRYEELYARARAGGVSAGGGGGSAPERE